MNDGIEADSRCDVERSHPAHSHFEGVVRRCIIAGSLAALCWSVADIWLVGFPIEPENYPLFSETYREQLGPEFATLMLQGLTKRLMWGGILVTFSLWMYLISIRAIVTSMSKWRHAKLLYVPLLICYSLDSLGHGAFFFVGEASKLALDSATQCQPGIVHLAAVFHQLLMVHWIAAVGLNALLWGSTGRSRT